MGRGDCSLIDHACPLLPTLNLLDCENRCSSVPMARFEHRRRGGDYKFYLWLDMKQDHIFFFRPRPNKCYIRISEFSKCTRFIHFSASFYLSLICHFLKRKYFVLHQENPYSITMTITGIDSRLSGSFHTEYNHYNV